MSDFSKEIKTFLQSCQFEYSTGFATEHSYRPALKALLEKLDNKLVVINEPKRQKVGAPDFILLKDDVQVGFIEAKDINESTKFDDHKVQITKYQSLGNLCFTNNLEWKFYKGNELVGEVSIGKMANGKIEVIESNLEPLSSYLAEFVSRQTITIRSSKQLAIVMANKAKTMRDILIKIIQFDYRENNQSEILNEYEAFKKILIHDLTVEEFADIYSQTITYGLFTARYYDKSPSDFTRLEAAETLPKSNPFLRKLFQSIASFDLDERLSWVVDNLVYAFAHTDVNGLMHDFGSDTKMSDPVLHFYETFLREYSPKARKLAGVYYTPDPVVKFIVRSVDEILKNDFNLSMGLADSSKIQRQIHKAEAQNRSDIKTKAKNNNHKQYFEEFHRVQILDPATGTGTFLLEVFKTIHDKFKNNKGIWQSYAQKDLLPRVHGFELLMAPYSMAHLKLAMFLSETGVEIKDRLSVYLTNSLEEPETDAHDLFSKWLSDESEEAARIKGKTPVMIVMGNPPYLGESQNKSNFIMRLLDDYKKEPGGKVKLKERNPKWINDDYIKFMRFAQHFVEKNGEGIIAFINPHGYLDNTTFRGVRWNLLKTFDDLYIIDLHGNSKKKETAKDGSLDENVFDIQQGVAINIFVKSGKKKNGELGNIYNYNLYGKREEKYYFLENNTIKSTPFVSIPHKEPMYFMVQKNFSLECEYDEGIKLSELFTLNNVGIVTARDEFTIHHTRQDVERTINTFLELDDETARSKFNLGKDVRDWQVNYARNDLKISYPNTGKFTQISYRPFDTRWTYYTGRSKGFQSYPRKEIMQHMIGGKNLGIIVNRQIRTQHIFHHFITDKPIDLHIIETANASANLIPLYLNIKQSNDLLEQEGNPLPNLNVERVKEIEYKLEMQLDWEADISTTYLNVKEKRFSPRDLLDYIYAVLHSPQYREKYKEFLKIDFPKIPFDVTSERFWELVEVGSKLRKLHLMEDIDLSHTTTGYPVVGNNIVGKVTYSKGKVWINSTQYFENIPEEVWNVYIGGYQPAQKWLKDRKGRELAYEDIMHYQKVIYILLETFKLMNTLDLYA